MSQILSQVLSRLKKETAALTKGTKVRFVYNNKGYTGTIVRHEPAKNSMAAVYVIYVTGQPSSFIVPDAPSSKIVRA